MHIESMPKDFLHNRLKAYRKANGLTQLQVANALGIDRSTYTYYETGRSHPNYDQLTILSKIYNIHPGDFLENETPVYAIGDKPISPEEKDSDNTDPHEPMTLGSLTREEQDLILKFRLYSKKQKEELLTSLGVKSKNQD